MRTFEWLRAGLDTGSGLGIRRQFGPQAPVLDCVPAVKLRAVLVRVHPRRRNRPCVAQKNRLGKSFRPRTCGWVAVSAAILLSGCAHTPLTRSCLTRAQYEQLKASEPPKVHSKLTGKADEDVRPLAGSALELRSWGHALLDTLKICSTP